MSYVSPYQTLLVPLLDTPPEPVTNAEEELLELLLEAKRVAFTAVNNRRNIGANTDTPYPPTACKAGSANQPWC